MQRSFAILTLLVTGCGPGDDGLSWLEDAPSASPQGPNDPCPYKEVASYDGYPIFSNTCLDNVPFYTSDGKTYDPNGYYTGLRWQCVEWAERYFLFKWGVTGPNGQMPWGGIAGAKDMCEKSAQYYAERGLAKTSTAVAGDLMVFNTGQCNADFNWGHVGLVIGEGASHYVLAQQNAGDASSIANVPKNCAYCFIHALSNDAGAVDPTVSALLASPDRFGGQQTSDVDGDGRADLCGRDDDGFSCALASGDSFTTIAGPAISNATGWGDPSNYTTLRMADFDGDGRADLCGRANDGIVCWPSTGDGFGPSYSGPALSDALGWNELPFYTSLRVGDLDGDGKSDLCVRASDGVRCFPSTGRGFGPEIVGPALTDDSGWLGLDHNATLQLADVDGDGRDDVCARAGAGIRCWPSTGSGFGEAIAGPAWSDEDGWDEPAQYSTIRFVDVDGDGRADVCGRDGSGFACHLATGSGFGPAIAGPAWSDEAGWAEDSRASTIALADIDGDGDRDVCARDAAGTVWHPFTGEGFGEAITWPELSDAKGWSEPHYYRTIRFADVDGDGRADVCGRAAAGARCWLSTGSGFSDTPIAGPAWSDEAGWLAADHYQTFRVDLPTLPVEPTEPPGEDPVDPPDPELPSGGAETPMGSSSGDGGCSLAGEAGEGWLPLVALLAVRRRRRR